MSSQFGAFPFGARQFDACQFGAFHFDAVPVRRVSLWRNASLARFTVARFPFLCLTAQKCFLPTPVWRRSVFFMRVSLFCVFFLCVSRISFCPYFSFVCRVSRFVPMLIDYASMVCSTRSIYICDGPFCEEVVFYARISFLRIFPLCVAHHLFINLINVSSRLHYNRLVY